MDCPVLIFTNDDRLSRSIEDGITSESFWSVTTTDCTEAARKALHGADRPVAFVDLRPETGLEHSAGHLLAYLATQCPVRAHVVTISDQLFALGQVPWIDLLAVAHLEYPFADDEIEATWEQLHKLASSRGKQSRLERRQIEVDKFSFSTYTPGLFFVLDQLLKVAVHNVTLLLVGETGTGKTTLAKMIHQLSPYRDEPFQNVACGALPPDLIESELFGHIRGAFTGADRSKIGRFEAAGQGTLLLDEIDVLGSKEQAKLLKVIETGEFEPVGSTETRISNARLIVASNVDLETLTESRQFRKDLYYRLNVLEFRLPPVRERPLDVAFLVCQFVEECCQQHGIIVERVHRKFLDAIKQYPWPGNLRELKNQIQRSVLFCANGELTPEDLSPNVLNGHFPDSTGSVEQPAVSLSERVAVTEKQILEETLRAHNYKRTAAAEALGLSRVGLYKKMRKYGMIKRKDRRG